MDGAIIEKVDGERYITIFKKNRFDTFHIPKDWKVVRKNGLIILKKPRKKTKV